MLMRTNYETLSSIHCVDNKFDIKPGKYELEKPDPFSLRCPTPDCDTKRTGPCKSTENPKT